MACPVAMPARSDDVGNVVAATLAARDEVLGSATQMRWTYGALKPHAKAAVVALTALAIESDLSGAI